MTNTNSLPNDIINDILIKLPEKSLLRFKPVCKSWRSLIEDPQFVKNHYYLNQILKALEKDRGCSIDYSIIDPPSVITHQLCVNFANSRVNDVFLLAIPLPDKIVFWNPENLGKSTIIRLPIQNSALFTVGECAFMIKSSNTGNDLEVWSMRKNESTSCSWRKMLEIEDQGNVFLKKGKKGRVDFLFFRRDKNECAVYDSKTREWNKVTGGVIEARRKLKEFKLAGPQVAMFIDRTYVETLISPNVETLISRNVTTISNPQFIKYDYYLNQILKALKKDRDLSIDDPIINPPSVITHQLSIKFAKSSINGFLLLAVPLPDKIVLWNPEDLRESTSICRPLPYTTSFTLGERIFLAKFSLVPFLQTSSNKMDGLKVLSMSKNTSTWINMLKIEEQGHVFLKKDTGDFLFFRRYKDECVVYDSKTRDLNEVSDGIIEAKRKMKEFNIEGPQVSLFIDRIYAETLISPDAAILEV